VSHFFAGPPTQSIERKVTPEEYGEHPPRQFLVRGSAGTSKLPPRARASHRRSEPPACEPPRRRHAAAEPRGSLARQTGSGTAT
jgi:hypothetical protein